MGYVKIRTMHIDHIVAERSHLIGKSRLMAVQTVGLLVTGLAIDGLVLGIGPVVHGPEQAMGLQTGKHNLIDKVLLMAVPADLVHRLDVVGILKMASRTALRLINIKVGGMVKVHRLCRHHNQQQEQ